jgi:hypothetical protein
MISASKFLKYEKYVYMFQENKIHEKPKIFIHVPELINVDNKEDNTQQAIRSILNNVYTKVVKKVKVTFLIIPYCSRNFHKLHTIHFSQKTNYLYLYTEKKLGRK